MTAVSQRCELREDPMPCLLEPGHHAGRYSALRMLLDRDENDPGVRHSPRVARQPGAIAANLKNRQPDGFWARLRSSYAPKYTDTGWSVMFLDQIGLRGAHPRTRRESPYVLSSTEAENRGFGASGQITGRSPRSRVIDSFNGNLLRAPLGFGWLDDPRVERTVDWVRSMRDNHGRWNNRYAYHCKMWIDIDKRGAPSKWVAPIVFRAQAHAIMMSPARIE